MEERTDGSILIWHKNMVLKFKEITARPEKIIQPKISRPYGVPQRAHTPAANHPWKVRIINPQYKQKEELLLVEA
ncbi:MAG: hypothetical protein L6404_05735 [Candidatus Omnitrophica bacterium]|nr:hypothetical protein [Candidatus Omnitrophota bacterium]